MHYAYSRINDWNIRSMCHIFQSWISHWLSFRKSRKEITALSLTTEAVIIS